MWRVQEPVRRGHRVRRGIRCAEKTELCDRIIIRNRTEEVWDTRLLLLRAMDEKEEQRT